jgi:hypothetical protein
MKTKIAMFAAAATRFAGWRRFRPDDGVHLDSGHRRHDAVRPDHVHRTRPPRLARLSAHPDRAGSRPSTGEQASPATPGQRRPRAPAGRDRPSRPAPAGTTSTTSTAADADAAGTPSSANVAVDLKVGSEVKDPSGAVVGTIAGTTTGADGSTNVVVTSGEKKFALPKASFSAATTGGLQTTATKAQIDATLAGAKPQ